MKTIGSHPGAILFRLGIMIIIIAILVVIFFSYSERAQQNIERQSVLQTRRIIDSSLAVVFSTYAVKGRLDDLDLLDGGNPFEFLRDYEMLPAAYRGELDRDPGAALESGWYYLKHRGLVLYKPFHLERDIYFRLLLDFDDVNRSGHYEHGVDSFKGLRFTRNW